MSKQYYFFMMLYGGMMYASPTSVTNGGTGLAQIALAYGVLCGGTTTIAPFQSVAAIGTAGQALVSNGSAALPTFQNLTFAGGGTGATSLAAGVIASTGSALTSLGVGSDGQVLKNVSGTVTWTFSNILQIVSTSTSSAVDTSGGSSIPDDNSIPQFSEGTLILSLSITPKSASSTLWIIFSTGGSTNATSAPISALFVNSGPSAVAAQYIGQDNPVLSGVLQYMVASGSTTARTYQVRVGGGNVALNANSTPTRVFGGVAATSLVIIEFI